MTRGRRLGTQRQDMRAQVPGPSGGKGVGESGAGAGGGENLGGFCDLRAQRGPGVDRVLCEDQSGDRDFRGQSPFVTGPGTASHMRVPKSPLRADSTLWRTVSASFDEPSEPSSSVLCVTSQQTMTVGRRMPVLAV